LAEPDAYLTSSQPAETGRGWCWRWWENCEDPGEVTNPLVMCTASPTWIGGGRGIPNFCPLVC